ncbi:MAG: URC4/urg3 family protein, partial [Burkholderiaceae bacterium]|nr:URC4/urg3 family protein [Burkholderiaceae bacterium]
DATELLGEVLRTLGPIWPRGARIKGVAAGDVGAHRWAGDALPGGGHDATTGGWVPFHKLSQWMTYSLLEPLQWAGIGVTGLGGEHGLTGLPEYRNGGLFIDGGVIVPRSPWLLERTHKPEDETIVEWRALTVCLLDELAVLVRGQLGRDEHTLPLACVLEGGTWAAGRALAAERRPGGAPPLKVESDGTVF